MARRRDAGANGAPDLRAHPESPGEGEHRAGQAARSRGVLDSYLVDNAKSFWGERFGLPTWQNSPLLGLSVRVARLEHETASRLGNLERATGKILARLEQLPGEIICGGAAAPEAVTPKVAATGCGAAAPSVVEAAAESQAVCRPTPATTAVPPRLSGTGDNLVAPEPPQEGPDSAWMDWMTEAYRGLALTCEETARKTATLHKAFETAARKRRDRKRRGGGGGNGAGGVDAACFREQQSGGAG